MRRFNDSQAVSPIIGFMIATVVFSVSFYYVIDSAVQKDPERDEAIEYTAVANTLADIIMANGRQWYTPAACSASGVLQTQDFQPDEVGSMTGNPAPTVPAGRFGLGDENCGRSLTDPGARNNLSFDKFRNLYQAKMRADATNDKVDYEEARRSLGLAGQNLDFHLRSWPVLASVRQILGTGVKDPLMRPLYIGDYGSTSAAFTSDLISAIPSVVADDRISLVFSITNGGSATTMFSVQVEVRLADGTISFLLYTPEVPSTQTRTVSFTLKKSSDWAWKTQGQTELKEVRYQVWDKNDKLWPASGGSNSWATVSLSSYNMNDCSPTYVPCPVNKQVIVQSDRMYQQTAGSPATATMKAWHKAFTSRGLPVAINDWKLRLEKTDPAGSLVEEFPLPETAVTEGFVTRSTTDVQSHLAILQTNAGTEYNRAYVNVVSTPPAPFTPAGGSDYAARQSVIKEMGYMDRLIENFDPYVVNSAYDTAGDPFPVPYACPDPLPVGCGDVFPDLRDVMNNDLRTALTNAAGQPTTTRYTTLFVGSNVDHNAMTSQQAKGTIRDWVFAGGTLIVMGSDDQSVTWLEPIFHAALQTGSGGIYTPDQQHASLNVPNQLDYSSYQSTTSWSYNAGDGESFTHVVTQGTSDILAVGNPGAFGLGKVILTSWRAFQLTADQNTACPDPPAAMPSDTTCQALFLIHNLVTLSYRELYLDYGPPIPVGEPTGAQLRIGSVWHPELKQLIGVQIQIFVFPGGS